MSLVRIDFFFNNEVPGMGSGRLGSIITSLKDPKKFIFFLRFGYKAFSDEYFKVFVESLESNFGEGPYTMEQMKSKKVMDELNLCYLGDIYIEPGQSIDDFYLTADFKKISISEFSEMELDEIIPYYGGTIEKIISMEIEEISPIKIAVELYKDGII